MKQIIILFTLFLFLSPGIAQEVEVTEISQTKLEADRYIGADSFGAIFYIKDNIFYKIQGHQKWQYSNFLLGKLSQINIINPLKILLFYEQSNNVILLDKFLNEIKQIAFNELPDLKLVTQTATANDRSIWLFNSNTLQLEIFDYAALKTTHTTLPLDQIAETIDGDFNHCWVLTSDKGYKFNSYGSLLTTIEHTGFTDSKMTTSGVIFQRKQELYHYSDTSEKTIKIDLPEIRIKQFYVIDEILYIYDGKTIYNYQLNTPKN